MRRILNIIEFTMILFVIECLKKVSIIPGSIPVRLQLSRFAHSTRSVCSALKKLKVLGICNYRTSINVTIKVKDLDFIFGMPNLEYVDFMDVATLASVDDLDETTRKDYYDFITYPDSQKQG